MAADDNIPGKCFALPGGCANQELEESLHLHVLSSPNLKLGSPIATKILPSSCVAIFPLRSKRHSSPNENKEHSAKRHPNRTEQISIAAAQQANLHCMSLEPQLCPFRDLCFDLSYSSPFIHNHNHEKSILPSTPGVLGRL